MGAAYTLLAVFAAQAQPLTSQDITAWPELQSNFAGQRGSFIVVDAGASQVMATLQRAWPKLNWGEGGRYFYDNDASNLLLLLARHSTDAHLQMKKQSPVLDLVHAECRGATCASTCAHPVSKETMSYYKDMAYDKRWWAAYRISDVDPSKHKDDIIGVMDLGFVLGVARPVSLLWFSSEKVTATHGKFEFFSCMTGVACVPAPEWPKDYSYEPEYHGKFIARLASALRELPLESATNSADLLSACEAP